MSNVTEAPKASGSTLPKWDKPEPVVQEPVLRVYNSLTRAKDIFVPMIAMLVTWYNCGPTVYDASHMGHARNYLTQDIIRRILRDYFGYSVNFVMNITDIDDKIILRARETYLLERKKTSTPSITVELVATVRKAFDAYFAKRIRANLPSSVTPPDFSGTTSDHFAFVKERDSKDPEWAKAAREKDEKWSLYLTSLSRAEAAIHIAERALAAQTAGGVAVSELVDESADVLGPYLGEKEGHTIEEPIKMTGEFAAKYEAHFFDDMARLNVLPPDVVTRVSEYIPEIVAYVEKIIANGYAYVAGGNVWFDVAKFDGAKGERGEQGEEWTHEYAKLQPGSKGNKKLIDEGEGALTDSQGKRQPADFALWKSKRPGEPAWPSLWGEGRPGWHIECSVMASAILGEGMDIHSGGVDLMFPHHDNELAQSEAYHGCQQWVNFFLHTGHLHIEGLKMSKSLKNFITIEDALKDYSARQLRMAFMLQSWNAKMDLKKDLISDVRTKEETFDNFFYNVIARLRQSQRSSDGKHHFDAPEHTLLSDLQTAQHEFRVALCDSFNTPAALTVLLDIVSKVNVYLGLRASAANMEPVRVIADWVTRMLRMFGLGEGSYTEGQIGWGKVVKDGEDGGEALEKQAHKFVDPLVWFRDEIRKTAMAMEGGAGKDLLALCDKLRDGYLVELGVQLDDGQGAGGGALYKLTDPAILIRQRDEKAAVLAEKQAKKAAQAKEAETKRLALLEKGKVPPADMFRPPNVPEGTYTEWDEQGLPKKDGEGKEVAKSALKRLMKEQKAQEKAHEAWLAWKKEQEGK